MQPRTGRRLAVLAFVALFLVWSPSASMAAPLAWSAPVHVDTAGAITSLSCPATSFCAAVDNARNLLTSDPASPTWPATGTDTAAPLSVSCGSSSFCAVGDSGGSAVSYRNGSWGARVAPPGQSFAINAVSCTSSIFCLGGTEVTTTPRTLNGGATWVTGNTQGVDYPEEIRSASCAPGSDATTGFCVVVDTSNAAFPSSDSGVTFLPGNRPDGVISGASTLNSVSCTSSTSCVVVDAGGKAFHYRGGVLGGADWTAANADLGRSLSSVSCVPGSPSNQTFCAAVDSGGYVIETSDGGVSWSTPALITGTTGSPPLNAVSCVTASFCVAVDNGGNAYTGAPQTAPANTGTPPAPTADGLPAAPPNAPVPPTDILESSVRVGLRALSTDARTLKVPMSCPVPVTCTGRVVVDHFTPAVPRVAGAHKAGRIVLGTARFSLAGTSSRFVTVRLGRTAEEMLSRQRGHAIHVTLKASVSAIGYPSDVVGRYFRLTRRR
jgi:hypothetical protein